jgi:hypothetical protein
MSAAKSLQHLMIFVIPLCTHNPAPITALNIMGSSFGLKFMLLILFVKSSVKLNDTSWVLISGEN